MKEYNPKKIEKKWQKKWEEDGMYRAEDNSPKPKFYGLIEFPFPSGDGMHVGHMRSNTAMDIISRKRRMQGFNVLYPIGWDAFGLPTENYAIKTGKQPAVVTKKNTDNFRKQLKSAGFSFDWSREINTTDQEYYRWTQWIFLQFFKKGLAYKKKGIVNWCPKDKVGLANEEVIDGKCERCGTPVEKREKEQWMLAITKYAERLDKDLDTVDYEEKIKIQQRNWIGKSIGAEIKFNVIQTVTHSGIISDTPLANQQKLTNIKVFTTRPDTLFGVTYLVISPENELLNSYKDSIKNWKALEEYKEAAKRKSEVERTSETKEKTGVLLEGIIAVNPANNEAVPVFVADYVLAHYGTGAIMAVPAHDERDFEFARRHDLPIWQVIEPKEKHHTADTIYTGYGKLINSGEFDGLESEVAKQKIVEKVGGKAVTTFKLRDWVFSRQRYWGEPIPLVHCEECAKKDPNTEGWIAIPEDQLPLTLPNLKKYQPTDSGESPLATVKKWVNTTCPNCGGPAKRETDTMPQWAGSSWYYLRYADPKNDKAFADQEKLKYWTPVDWYNGGMEHTTLHLLYSRFWHKFLFDIGQVPTSEPYAKRTSQGLILAADGEKMSKSRGNVVNPDEVIEAYGADTLRLYEMFMGPFDQTVSWTTDSIIGPRRFLEKIWRINKKVKDGVQNTDVESVIHKTLKKVADDIEAMQFNTAISAMMIAANELDKAEAIPRNLYELFLCVLAPFAPHLTEELWSSLGHSQSIHLEKWPEADPAKIQSKTVTFIVQVNGKIRAEFQAGPEITEDEAKMASISHDSVKKWLEGKTITKIIFIKGKLINLVVS